MSRAFASAEAAAASVAANLKATVAAIWDYPDADGTVTFKVARFKLHAGGKAFRPLRLVAGKWEIGDPPGPLPLYRLPSLAAAAEALIVEGEKCADAAIALGFVATTSSHGALSASKTDWSPLAGKRVAISPDNDHAGWRYAEEVVRLLGQLDPAPEVRVIVLPELQEGEDIVDYVARREAAEWQRNDIATEIASLIECTSPVPRSEIDAPHADRGRRGASSADQRRDSKATRIVGMVLQSVELFHSPDGTPFADVIVDGHRETHALRSTAFRRWIGRRFFEAEESAPGSHALRDALDVLEGHATYGSADEHDVFVRVAALADRTVIDLADPDWRAIEIDATGWRIGQPTGVRFRRCAGMQPLPVPEAGGTIELLRPFLPLGATGGTPVGRRDDFHLIVSWLVTALLGRRPFPIAVLQGEQGSGKSTLATLLRLLIDPSTVALRSVPREERDLVVAANNAWLLSFDNLSRLDPWLADALCRIATGGGFGARQLYTDSDETLFSATRPLLLNGIADLVTRPDLGSRALVFRLPTLSDDRRRTEAEFWRAFERERSRIFGALLTGVSAAIASIPHTKLSSLPRLADFAIVATAAERALGWKSGEFLSAYCENKEDVIETELAADDVAITVRALHATRATWAGSATELLAELRLRTSEETRRAKGWPSTGQHLSGRLRRLAPALRHVGVAVLFDRGGSGTRTITIQACAAPPAKSVESVGSDGAPADATTLPQSSTLTDAERQALDAAPTLGDALADALDAADADRDGIAPPDDDPERAAIQAEGCGEAL